MKKLVLVFALLAFVLSANAQRSGSTTTFLPNETYKNLTMTTADTVETTSYWKFALNKPKTQYFSFAVGVDTATYSQAGHIWFTVWGSVDGSTWVNTGVTTVKFGASVDSTFSMSDVSTGVLWKYLKLQAVNINQAVRSHRISAISIKVGDK